VEADAAYEPTSVTITIPSEDPTYVTSDEPVTIQVLVEGATPDVLQLVDNGLPFVSIERPYTYQWDTPMWDGEHTIEARAVTGGQTVASDSTVIFLDRTPPTIQVVLPPGGALAHPSDSIEIWFSEAIDSSVLDAPSATTLRIDVGDGNGPVAIAHERTLTMVDRVLVIQPDANELVVPSVATVYLDGITDRAGHALEQEPTDPVADVVYTWWFPAFEGTTLPASAKCVDAAAASDGTLYLLYGVASQGALHVAAWDGADWAPVGGAVASWPFTRETKAQIAIAADGNPMVAIEAQRVYAWSDVDRLPGARRSRHAVVVAARSHARGRRRPRPHERLPRVRILARGRVGLDAIRRATLARARTIST
jgi:hypothetical protein